jgi:lipoprotein-anchoring transpeptidase ErfK/SrfK
VVESKATFPGTVSDGQPTAQVTTHVTGVWRTALLASVSALFVIGQADVAAAQFWRSFGQPRQDNQFRPAPKARKANRAPSKKDVPIRHPFGENMPKGPLQLMVSINDQRAVLYSNGVRVGETKVSTGTASHPTPTGVFSIIQKNRWHRSNLYGAAPMFFMHRLTWSGIALHEGHLPGFAASHGCIRMPTDFVSRLWNVSRLGMRVVVARVQLAPQEFTHAKLFQPAQKPIDNTPSTSEGPAELRRSLDTTGQGLVRFAQAETIASDAAIATDGPTDAQTIAAGASVAADKWSRQSAQAVGAEASAIVPATSTASDAGASSAPAPIDTAVAPVEPAPVVANAPAAIEPPAAATEVATTTVAPAAAASEPVTTSTVIVPAAEPASSDAAQSAETAPAETAPAAPAATAAAAASAEPARPAIDPDELTLPRPAPLRTRAAEPAKRNGQVAVFISGKEKRIFVRHAFVPVFDMPIEIENPGKPLGTHTFTALEAVDGGTRMRWNLVSMPLTAGQGVATPAGKKRAAKQLPKRPKYVRGAVITSESSNATEALDRVNIPQEALDRIAELLTPGSSLIISDEGLGRETGRYTEFIVETR